jgi:microcystin-dependent protein
VTEQRPDINEPPAWTPPPGDEPLISEVRIFAFGFAPPGWVPCDGRLLAIDDHQPLFSLIGWHYGGDGRSTFALPDRRRTASLLVEAIALHGVLAAKDAGHE